MIFFVSFYDKHPFDFDSPNVITSPILVSTPILSHLQAHQRLLRVIVVIISHIIGFFLVTYIKKKFRTKQVVARAWLNVSAARRFYDKYPSMRSQNTRNNFTTGSKSNVEMVITFLKETLLFRTTFCNVWEVSFRNFYSGNISSSPWDEPTSHVIVISCYHLDIFFFFFLFCL